MLLSLTVTVKKFMVMSVTVTVSKWEKQGLQDDPADESLTDSVPVVSTTDAGRYSFTCCSSWCFGSLRWETDVTKLVLWATWSLRLTSDLNAQLYDNPAPPTGLCSLQALGVIVVSSRNLLVSWMRPWSDLSLWCCERRSTASSTMPLCLAYGSAESPSSSSS